MLWRGRFGRCSRILDIWEFDVGILAFPGGAGNDFGRDHGDGLVAARTILLAAAAADEGGAPRGAGALNVACRGAEAYFGGFAVLARLSISISGGGCSGALLAGCGFGRFLGFGGWGGGFLRFLGGGFGRGPFDFLREIEAVGRDPF